LFYAETGVKEIKITGTHMLGSSFPSGGTSILYFPVKESSIPSWIKNISGFWANGDISDDEYLGTIRWLIDNGILVVSQSETETSQSQTKSYVDKGDFYAVYFPTEDYVLEGFMNDLQRVDKLETYASMFNRIFKLPYDVPLNFAECGSVNAFYDPSAKEITLCYELPKHLIIEFKTQGLDLDAASLVTNSVLLFVVHHELGHALIDIYDLPTTGMEEDAVNQFSALNLLDLRGIGQDIISRTAYWFSTESTWKGSTEQLAFWDEHSLTQQKFFNVLCWMYGSDTTGNSYLVTEGYLPADRAVRCTSEYEHMAKSWETLVSPYTQRGYMLVVPALERSAIELCKEALQYNTPSDREWYSEYDCDKKLGI